MANNPQIEKEKKGGKLEGEGSYEAGRKYNEHAKDFAKNDDEVEKKARQAADAVDGPEGEGLKRAEEKGKRGPM